LSHIHIVQSQHLTYGTKVYNIYFVVDFKTLLHLYKQLFDGVKPISV